MRHRSPENRKNHSSTSLRKLIGSIGVAAGVLVPASCSSNVVEIMPIQARTASVSPTPELPKTINVAESKLTMRTIAFKNAASVLRDLDVVGNGTESLWKDGNAYIGNKAAAIDPDTHKERDGYTAPVMRAIYLPKENLLEVYSSNISTVVDGPNRGQEQYDSVSSLFSVGSQAKIAKLDSGSTLNTDVFREAIADTLNVHVIGLSGAYRRGINESGNQYFGEVYGLSLDNGKIFKDSKPNIYGADFGGEAIALTTDFIDYVVALELAIISANKVLAGSSIRH